jgi:diguanylate cyclase (GGDEF)-like protein
VLEIDGLTSVNDSYGHQLGEELLRVLADRICSAVRGGDTVARLGSDEFAVLLEDLPDDKTASVIAAQIQAQLASPIRLGGHTVQVQSSVGIAFAGEDDVGAEELLRCAAAASYEARYQRDGKSRCCVFSPAMGAALADRLQLGEELRGAMERGELRVYYQPIVELATGRLSGCEALVRWMHPTRGLLAPGVFLPIAEQLGLLHEIDSWTLRVACNEAAGWVREFPGRGELSIDVNVSPSQLREDTFVGLVAGAISRSGLEPHRLVLELVESSVVDDLELARARLAELKALGVRLAVDDFGTGYSSLSHLRVLPIDVIKIDRSFVAAMEQSAQAGALVSSLIQLASALGIDTVAEGIEDHFQLARLKSENCRYGQGYLFARPLDQEAFRALLGSKGSSGVTGRSAVTVS